jgi:hypothetical protein
MTIQIKTQRRVVALPGSPRALVKAPHLPFPFDMTVFSLLQNPVRTTISGNVFPAPRCLQKASAVPRIGIQGPGK